MCYSSGLRISLFSRDQPEIRGRFNICLPVGILLLDLDRKTTHFRECKAKRAPSLEGELHHHSTIRPSSSRLTAHAYRFLNTFQSTRSERVIQGTGLSPEDFAIQVVTMFAVGELSHDASKGIGGLIRHLTVAMDQCE